MFNIDEVVEGYWESAMWTTDCNGMVTHLCCDGEDCQASLQDVLTRADVAAETWPKIHEACLGFLQLIERELGSTAAVELGWTGEEFGHDLWLTRNGHGAGFWDRGQGELGKWLTKWAKVEGEANLTVGDDGMIYHD